MVQTYERNERQLTAKQLYEIQQAELRHERALKLKRREKRIARAKRAERDEYKAKAQAFDEIKVELKRKFDIESKRLRRANRNLKDNASKEYIIGKIPGQNVELINIMTTISDLERGE